MRRDLSSWLGSLGMTGRKATYRRTQSSRTLKSRGAAHAISLAGGEPLDPRKMLAVTTNFNAISGELDINLTADNDIAGLVLNTGTSKYEVYDDATKVDEFLASTVKSISVIDSKGGLGANQTFEVRDGGAIAASLSVSQQVETTKITDDVKVTSASTFGGFGIAINSPTIQFDDASLGDPLYLSTDKTNIGLGKAGGNGMSVIGGTDVDISTGTGAGNIDFLDDILGGEASGTLTLAAGTGVITFAGDIGGTGEDEALLGVVINSAKSVTVTGQTYLDGTSVNSFTDGFTIGDGVNNVDLSNGGVISGFGEDGAGIFINGSSTNSTIKSFLLQGNTYGIYAGNYFDTLAIFSDLSGTVIDDNQIGEDDIGIYLDSVAGNLNGEDAFVIGGTAGNVIAANGQDGIYGFASTGVEIRNNLIIANGEDGLGAGSGIALEGGGEYLITENTIGEDGVGPFIGLGNSYDGITIDGEDGFYSYAGTEIVNNDIEYNAAYGVRVQGVTLDTGEDSILIFDNYIANNGVNLTRASAGIGGIRIDGSENIRIINNDIVFNNGEDAGNGIDIVTGSHGTLVFSNNIVENSNHGIYVEDSSTEENPVQIGEVLGIASFTATTVAIEGDARAEILPGQQIGLAYVVDPTNVATATLITRTVVSVSYDEVADATTLTFSDVPGSPYAVTLGNYIFGNGEDSLAGSGISVLATGEGSSPSGGVQGIEILGNVIVGNQVDGIHLESIQPASFGDLSGVLIAGNFVGRDPVGGASPYDFGNGEDGIQVINGDGIAIQINYIAANGDDGIEIRGSLNVDIGEDGLGNYIVRNADDGVNVKGSQFVTIVDNEIAFNGDDGIEIEALGGTRSADILIEGNWIHDNGDDGIEVDDSDRVTITDNLVEGNADDGIEFQNTRDALVSFNIIAGNGLNGVEFSSTNGVIEGNEIYDNFWDGVLIVGNGQPFSGDGEDHFEVLGNIIRNNGDDGVDVQYGNFYGGDRDGEPGPSRVAGNTIELNDDDGVSLSNLQGVLVGGEFPSDINFINLNGNAGVYATGAGGYATGIASAFVIGNEIDSNVNYGVEIDSGEDLTVGGPSDEAVNTIRRNGKAGVYAYGETYNSSVLNNEISQNPVGVMITSALGLQVGGSNSGSPGEDFGNHIFDNGEGVRATGDSYLTYVVGNLIEDNLTGATLASVRGLTFGYGEAPVPVSFAVLPEGSLANIVIFNNEGLRGSGDLTDTNVSGNEFIDNTKVGIALQSAKNLTVGGYGEDSPNFIGGSPVGLSASGTMTGTEVVFNEFFQNTIGIALSKATGMLVGGNTIDESEKFGISVTGNNAGTVIFNNIVTNTEGQPGYEHGIYLDGAKNVDVIDNTVSDSKGAGIYVTGNTLGTAVQGNYLDGNRFGIAMINATNAVIGGLGEDEGNTIVGGGDSAAGDYRDGIYASGTLTGSSITGTDITDASTGVLLESALGLLITETTVTDSQRFGLFARGDNEGTTFTNGTITGTGGVPSTEHGIALYDANNLTITNSDVNDSLGAGLYVTGDTTGTVVENNTFDGNRFGIALVNATNAVIGGVGEDEGNVIIGGGDPLVSDYRDGIYAAGTNTGSSITQTTIRDTWTGINLVGSTGLTITDAAVLKATGFGLYAQGVNTGTLLDDLYVEQDPVSSTSIGSILSGAEGLTIDNSGFLGDGTALYVIGGANGTIIEDSAIDGEDTGLNVLGAVGLTVRRNFITGVTNGLIVSNTCTGTSFTANTIVASLNVDGGAAVSFYSVAGATFDDNTTVTTANKGFGLYATGNSSGTLVRRNTFNQNVVGVYLNAATNIVLGTDASTDGNTISNATFAGLQAAGACTNSFVYDTTWTSNAQNVFSTATGLTISPAAPS
jgi:parallel beta-helix repeat protein